MAPPTARLVHPATSAGRHGQPLPADASPTTLFLRQRSAPGRLQPMRRGPAVAEDATAEQRLPARGSRFSVEDHEMLAPYKKDPFVGKRRKLPQIMRPGKTGGSLYGGGSVSSSCSLAPKAPRLGAVRADEALDRRLAELRAIFAKNNSPSRPIASSGGLPRTQSPSAQDGGIFFCRELSRPRSRAHTSVHDNAPDNNGVHSDAVQPKHRHRAGRLPAMQPRTGADVPPPAAQKLRKRGSAVESGGTSDTTAQGEECARNEPPRPESAEHCKSRTGSRPGSHSSCDRESSRGPSNTGSPRPELRATGLQEHPVSATVAGNQQEATSTGVLASPGPGVLPVSDKVAGGGSFEHSATDHIEQPPASRTGSYEQFEATSTGLLGRQGTTTSSKPVAEIPAANRSGSYDHFEATSTGLLGTQVITASSKPVAQPPADSRDESYDDKFEATSTGLLGSQVITTSSKPVATPLAASKTESDHQFEASNAAVPTSPGHAATRLDAATVDGFMRTSGRGTEQPPVASSSDSSDGFETSVRLPETSAGAGKDVQQQQQQQQHLQQRLQHDSQQHSPLHEGSSVLGRIASGAHPSTPGKALEASGSALGVQPAEASRVDSGYGSDDDFEDDDEEEVSASSPAKERSKATQEEVSASSPAKEKSKVRASDTMASKSSVGRSSFGDEFEEESGSYSGSFDDSNDK